MGRTERISKAPEAAVWLVLAMVLTPLGSAGGQNAASLQNAPRNLRPQRVVLVSIPDRKLAVLENGKVIRKFVVSVGAPESPSPVGEFRIVNRVTNPTYYHPGVVIAADRNSPIGPRWVGLSRKGYGIHGTNEPRSIGKAASHGCIRLRNGDIKEFFAMVSVGNVVEIRGEGDEQIAQIFAGATETQNAAVAQAQPMTMAAASGQ